MLIYEDEETRELKKKLAEIDKNVNWSQLFKEAVKDRVSNTTSDDRIYYLQERLDSINYQLSMLEDNKRRILKELEELKEKKDIEKSIKIEKQTREEEIKTKIKEQQEKEAEMFNK